VIGCQGADNRVEELKKDLGRQWGAELKKQKEQWEVTYV
jgi:hypothetical protein